MTTNKSVIVHEREKRVSYRLLTITAVKHESEVNQVEYGKAAEANVCQNNVHICLQKTPVNRQVH